MKKMKFIKSVLFLSFIVVILVVAAKSLIHFPKIKINAEAAVLMDADTGKIYYEHNANMALPPASMSKMMTELLVLEGIHEGKISWDEPVSTSRYAANVTGSEIGLKYGDVLPLRQMFEAMVVHSANDAAIALAEHIGGSEKQFVQQMNAKAKEIGLSTRTKFANCTGLTSNDLLPFKSAASEGETSMSAQDLAKMAQYLIKTYPDILSVTQLTDVDIPLKNVSLHTTNYMLPGEPYAYAGNDGFKTGYTQRAGYCFTGTSERNGKRFIAVVMGSPDKGSRFSDAAALFDYGFGSKRSFSLKSWLNQTALGR